MPWTRLRHNVGLAVEVYWREDGAITLAGARTLVTVDPQLAATRDGEALATARRGPGAARTARGVSVAAPQKGKDDDGAAGRAHNTRAKEDGALRRRRRYTNWAGRHDRRAVVLQ